MNIKKNNNYIVITGSEDFEAALSAFEKESDSRICAVVFSSEKEFGLTEKQKEAVMNLPVITAVYGRNLSAFPADTLMSFDLRFSEDVYSVSFEDACSFSVSRFEILFGTNRTAGFAGLLRQMTESGSAELPYFSVTSESPEQYFERIFREKDDTQLAALTECLVSLRNGETEKGFEKESVNFYKLIRNKIKE